MQYDVIIIGGGISSLALASLVSKSKKSVLVIEKESEVGGSFKPWEKDYYIFDNELFFNFFCNKGRIYYLLRNLGEKPKFLITGTPKLISESGLYPIPLSPLGILKSKFITRIGKLQFFRYFIPFLFKNNQSEIPLNAKFKDVFKKELNDYSLKEYFHAISLIAFNCHNFWEVPFNSFKSLFRHFYNFKISYPLGSWKEIISILKYNINKNGKILTNTKVEKIIFENQIPTSINTNEENIKGKVIVSSIPIKSLKEIIDDNSTIQKLEQLCLEPVIQSVIIYYIGLSKNICNMKNAFVILDPPTIGFFNSNSDPSLAPPHKQSLTLMMMTKNDEPIEKDEERLKAILKLTFNNIENHVEFEEKKATKITINTIKKFNNSIVRSLSPDCLNIPNFFLLNDILCGNGIKEENIFSIATQTFELIKIT